MRAMTYTIIYTSLTVINTQTSTDCDIDAEPKLHLFCDYF